MKIFRIVIGCIAIIATSCSTSKYNVIKVTEDSYSTKDGFFYYLPKAVIAVDVIINKTSHVPGPYQEYAEQYIGYSGIQKRSTYYEIASVTMNTIYEPDPAQLYYVELDDDQQVYVELEDNGLIRKVNITSSDEENRQITEDKKFQSAEKEEKDKLMTLLNFREKIDTQYRREIVDSVVFETMTVNKVFIKSSVEESAKEAAQRLQEIRNNKFKLITFNDEITYADGTLETMIRELDKMEEEYFKLFLGYSQVEKIKYTFYFIPDLSQRGFQPLFKFSLNSGISDSLKMVSETVYLVQENAGKSSPTRQFLENSKLRKSKKDEKNQGFAYRIPEQVNYEVVLNGKPLAASTLIIPQFGTLHRLPGRKLEELQIQFDLNNGGIRILGNNTGENKR